MWGTTSLCAKPTGDSCGAFEAPLIGTCRLFRSMAENCPLRLLGLLQRYRPKPDFLTPLLFNASLTAIASFGRKANAASKITRLMFSSCASQPPICPLNAKHRTRMWSDYKRTRRQAFRPPPSANLGDNLTSEECTLSLSRPTSPSPSCTRLSSWAAPLLVRTRLEPKQRAEVHQSRHH